MGQLKDLEVDSSRLVCMENSLEELKRVISDCKAKANLYDDLVNVVIEAVIDNDLNIDAATIVFIEEAAKALTEALNHVAQFGGSSTAAAGNGGEHKGSSGGHN